MTLFRHLPPTATPLTVADVRAGWAGTREGCDARDRFRQALSAVLEHRPCALAASGRAALYLLLTALRERPGSSRRREILLPAYTCPALVTVILDAGLVPRLVDIAPETLDFDYDRLNETLGAQTLAVVSVHPFGIPTRVDLTIRAAHEVGALVIEDAAQAMGARLDGRPVGTFGEFGLLSFGPGKPLALGGGGALCAAQRYADLVAGMRSSLPVPARPASLAAFARLIALSTAFHPAGWWLATRLQLHRAGDHEGSWGFRLRPLSGAQSAAGLSLLPRLSEFNRVRRRNASRLITGLSGRDDVRVPWPPPGADPIYLRLPLLTTHEEHRDRLFDRLWAAGLGAGRLYRRPLNEIFPRHLPGHYPGAASAARRLLTLPTHHYLAARDVERMIEIIRRG